MTREETIPNLIREIAETTGLEEGRDWVYRNKDRYAVLTKPGWVKLNKYITQTHKANKT